VNNNSNKLINVRLFINGTIKSLLQQPQFIDLQFIFIKPNYTPDQLLTNFDIDVTQLSFNGENLQGTTAAIQAIRTSTIIHYGLNNDDKDYAPMATRISKYVRYGFKLLTPCDFNVKRFEVSPTYISNRGIQLHIQQNDPNQDQGYSELSYSEYNYINQSGSSSLVF
ncbi:unnamed protein product, partial [Rotaria sp. Silwood1]